MVLGTVQPWSGEVRTEHGLSGSLPALLLPSYAVATRRARLEVHDRGLGRRSRLMIAAGCLPPVCSETPVRRWRAPGSDAWELREAGNGIAAAVRPRMPEERAEVYGTAFVYLRECVAEYSSAIVLAFVT